MLAPGSNSEGDPELQDLSGDSAQDPIAMTGPEAPPLDDYSIREDDDDITSSDEQTDEQTDEHHDSSSFRSWFSRSRHHNPASESLSPAKLEPFSSSECAIAEGTPNRSGSSSSFRKGIKALFRRDSAKEGEEMHIEDGHALMETPTDDTKEDGNERKPVDNSGDMPETPTNNSKFWRSWRSGHHHHHYRHRHSTEVHETLRVGGEADPETLRIPSLDVGSMISNEEKRQKNMARLADQLEDVSSYPSPEQVVVCPVKITTPEESVSDVGSSQSDSTSSSIERALNVKERVGLVFSALPAENDGKEQNEISPLTPPGDTVGNPYKDVFDHKGDPNSYMAQDSTLLFKNCEAFKNVESALQLLRRDSSGLTSSEDHSSAPLSEITNELLDLIRYEMEFRERSIKERDVLTGDLTSLQKQITSLQTECEGKNSKIQELQKGLDAANAEIGRMDNDLEEAAEEVDMLTQEVDSYKGKIQEVKSKERRAIENLENRIAQMNEEMESKTKVEALKETKLSEEKVEKLQSDYETLIDDHKKLQENYSTTAVKLTDLVGKYGEKNEAVEATSTKLRQHEKAIEVLKIGNLKIQENFHRERRKVLDLRQDVNYLGRQLHFIECHRTQSLQFMSHLMLYYRGIATDETLTEYDKYLKQLSAIDYLPATVHLEGDELKTFYQEREALVVKFYNDVAKKLFLDQVIAKHVAYMRSNKFLSGQLAGLRKRIDEHDQYVNRLLKEIQTHKKQEEKNKKLITLLQEKNIDNKSKPSQVAK